MSCCGSEESVSWCGGYFLLGLGIGEVAAAAMGAEDDGLVLGDGWIRSGPCGGLLLVFLAGGLVGGEVLFFRLDEVFDEIERRDGGGVIGISKGDADDS